MLILSQISHHSLFYNKTKIETMNLYPLPFILLFLGILIKFRAPIRNPTHLTGDVSINCGSRGNSAANNGREWTGDIQPKFSSWLQIKGSSTTSTVIPQLVTADPVPHKTARISQSQFSYAFQVSAGQKIIRLHFNPTSYKGFKGLNDLFTVEAGPFTLLGNFSASLTADALGVDSFVKEFCLDIQENQQLNIFFSPEGSQSLDTYAFINGIEIFSVPASLSYFQGGDVGLQLVGEKSPVYIDSSTALEIIHLVEIEQIHVKSSADFDGMFLKWANRNAKKRNNFTWKMPVDVGFKYLIRVHLSELGLKIAGTDGNMFKVFINEMIARTNVDVVKEKDENNIPWHRDYMVMMRGNKKEGKRDILISLQSYDELIDDRALLTGFEIFKLSNNDNSLASPNPLPLARDPPLHTVETLFLSLFHRSGIANVAIAIISLVCVTVHKLRETHEANITEEGNKSKRKPLPLPSVRAERRWRRFSLNEVQLATKNFSDALLIGEGGFGRVYKGVIDEGKYTVAVKRSKTSSEHGADQFWTEIETLSELRHANLVSLIGYCNEQGEMILVYEYMPCGTLADHLYKLAREGRTCFSLTWKQRLDICIGAGRGIDYLHTGHGVIHRDVKPSNILLDENLIAKVSDFGLAKLESRSKLQTHVSTNVKGTLGYLDPNYYNTCKLTRESDTYAFGVVLLEVLCGRPAVDSMVAEDEKVLLMWARDKITMGEVDQIVSTSLREEISPNSLKTFVEVARRCLSAERKKRPTMSQVVSQLESAAQQQETKQPMEIAATSVSDDSHCPNNDKDGLSVQTGQPTIFLTAVQNPTHPPKEQTNNHCPNNDKDGLSVQTGQPTILSTDVQDFRPPPKEQSNSEMVAAQLPFKENELSSLPAEFDLSTSAPSINESCSTTRTMRPPADLCRQFSFEEIKAATCNFDKNSIVGRGGYFKVYKGFVKDGTTTVAMKRLNVQLDKGAYMFLSNIKMMLEIRHLHLVSLIGYCDNFNEMILVYDYMANGSLHDHLYNSENPQLTWKTRLQICIGAAIGLNYLRAGTKYPIMHRKVNSTNILLDEKWVAKVSVGPIAGKYWDLLQARIKNSYDVYDLGMVLLEVLFAKPAEQADSDIWAEVCKRERILEPYIDSNLYGQIAPECLSIFVETALACIKISESERPAMSDVIRSLEFAMQLQESVEHRSADDGGDNFP